MVAVADDLLYKIEAALRFPKRGKQSVSITSSILLSDKGYYSNKKLSKIIKASNFYHPSWHTLVISPHGDKNVVSQWEDVTLCERKRRRQTRFFQGQEMKPFRGFEMVVKIIRKIKIAGE